MASDNPDMLTPEEQVLVDADQAADTAIPPANQSPSPPAADAETAPDAARDAAGDATAADEPGEQKQKSAMVPHGALHEERRMRQEAERRAALLEERMNLILQRIPQQEQPKSDQPQTPPIPELDKDPVGNLSGRLDRQDNILRVLAQAIAGQGQQTQQQQETAAMAARATAMEREFAARTPDYQQALDHLLNSRVAELAAAGLTDPAEVQMLISREAGDMAKTAMQRGINPAELVYKSAQARGYRPKPPTPPPNNGAAEQIETIARGQQQSRGVHQVAGRAGAPTPATVIADMPQEEFDAWLKKAKPGEITRVFGA